jgi:hypothetical protein
MQRNQIKKNIWLRMRLPEFGSSPAWDFVGEICIENNIINFNNYHKKYSFIVKNLHIDKFGNDPINTWIKVEDVSGKCIFMCDGGLMGWRGILGGTRKLFNYMISSLNKE